MDIVIHAMGLPFNGETIKERSLGGSESAAYYQAKELAARGHNVQIWTTHEKGGMFDGVLYTPVGQLSEATPLGADFTFYATKTPHDVLIIQRHPLGFHKDYASKINVWQLHDTALHRTNQIVQGGLPRLDVVTTVSDWHGQQVSDIWGIGPDTLRTVPNGVDTELYQGPYEPHPTVMGLKAEGKFVMLYQSRPERGLEYLLKPDGIMAKLAQAKSNAHLIVCGYDHAAPEMIPYYQQLQAWGEALPNTVHVGCLPKEELARLQRGCDLLIYPTTFAEVSCITAMEAMHAGLPILTSPYAALKETCEGSGTIFVDLLGKVQPAKLDNLIAGIAQQDIDLQAYVDQVKGLEHNQKRLDQLKVKQLKAAQKYTWVKAVDRLEQVIREAFERRQKPPNMLRHFIEHSDIRIASTYPDLYTAEGEIAISARHELKDMYAFADPDGDPTAIRRHYEYWEGKNCDRLAETGRGDVAVEIEQFTRTTRFRGILQFVARGIREATARIQLENLRGEMVVNESGSASQTTYETTPRKVRVMEFGCAHGHVILPLAKIFPDAEFVGVDFMERSVRMATESAETLSIGNVTFKQRDQKELADDLGKFDVIIAAEVLEHVWDFQASLYALRDRLEQGGTLVTTTPCGRWEWSGRDNWRKGRQHLHHFERQDLLDIFGPWDMKRVDDMLYAPTDGHDTVGGQMGSWLCYVQPKDIALGEIGLLRKYANTAPRQTVSLCMIVKDGEGTLHKVLNHALPYVDQLVIGVDRGTTDRTQDILGQLSEAYPQVPFTVLDIESPLSQGFAAARNQTIEKADGDWILWMDADEELPYAFNIHRALRPSTFNAFACPQIHYSAMPAQVLATDFPCRLFRNNRGVKFYGLVHEHPEETPGKAISHSMLTSDIQFIHSGYVDENIRRARYQRNLPLLMRDVEENPDRSLNRFLLLRDISQGIAFENQVLGQVTAGAQDRGRKGVELFKKLLDEKLSLRMTIDALPYYSTCVECLGTFGAFDSEVTVQVSRVGTPSMSGTTTLKARFEDRGTYLKLLTYIVEESTNHYESKYA